MTDNCRLVDHGKGHWDDRARAPRGDCDTKASVADPTATTTPTGLSRYLTWK